MTIQRARKKPIEIEFVRYDGFEENGEEVELFIGNAFDSHIPSRNEVLIFTMEGLMTASQGDVVIKGVNGEFYPCKPDIFAEIYEPVDGEG